MKTPILTLFFTSITLYAQSTPLRMPREGCPMAHCTHHLSDQIGLDSPSATNITVTDVDSSNSGSGLGLGCASNGAIVACSFNAADDRKAGLKVYNSEGSILVTDQSVLDYPLTHNAERSAPIVFGNSNDPRDAVLAVDDCHVALIELIDGKWTQRWESPIPTCNSQVPDSPISPVLLGDASYSNFILFQTSFSGTIYTYDLEKGVVVQSGAVSDEAGDVCVSNNTPAVHNRDDSSEVYLIDVCTSPNGSRSYGAVVKLAVSLDNGTWDSKVFRLPDSFSPPSFASPTYVNTTLSGCSADGAVYFDSSPGTSGGAQSAYWGLSSDGQCYVNTLGNVSFPGEFKANSPHDDVNGGLWVWDTDDERIHFLRVPDLSEDVTKSFTIPRVHSDEPLVPSSAMSLSTEPVTKNVVLTLSLLSPALNRGYLLAEKVGSPTVAATGPLWELPIPGGNYSGGQFPIVQDSVEGKQVSYVVFSGYGPGTYFVGCPNGRC